MARIRFTGNVFGFASVGQVKILDDARASAYVHAGVAVYADARPDTTPTPTLAPSPPRRKTVKRGPDLDAMTIAMLRKHAKKNKVDLTGLTLKADIVAAIKHS